jgi:DNA-binding SARP family transcriptional activator
LRVALLGTPEITRAGAAVAVGRRQTRALLFRLAAQGGAVSRAHLCHLFWPDLHEGTARRNLTRVLVNLREALGEAEPVVVADSDTIAVDATAVWRDTAEFLRLAAVPDTPARAGALRQAVALYRGPFLDGVALGNCPEFEAWADGERQEWTRRCCDVLAAVVEDRTLERDYPAAIDAAQRYLATDQLAEHMHQRLIRLYAASGDRLKALRQFQHCAEVLHREIGVPPHPETRSVYEEVLAATPRRPPVSAESLAGRRR